LLEDENNRGADGVRWSMEYEDEAGQKAQTTNACLLFAQNVVIGHKLWQALSPRYRRWTLPAQKVSLAPDLAELSLLATQDSTNQAQQPVHPGQVLFKHTLGNDERHAVRVVADVLRAAGQAPLQFKKAVQR